MSKYKGRLGKKIVGYRKGKEIKRMIRENKERWEKHQEKLNKVS